MVGGQARLTVVRDEGEAELVCGMLRAEGIPCFHRTTDVSAHAAFSPAGHWREILVLVDDLARARALMQTAEPVVDECVRCGRALDEGGGWFPDETGELKPYCGVCAERVFGPA